MKLLSRLLDIQNVEGSGTPVKAIRVQDRGISVCRGRIRRTTASKNDLGVAEVKVRKSLRTDDGF